MGLLPQMARVILHQHKLEPISGKVLLIGRQTVPLTKNQAVRLVQDEGVSPRANAVVEVDTRTRSGEGKQFITDASLFQLFTEATVQALDVSDYEGAEIVCNLNEQVPDRLVGQFDFIYNGSCLDNLFDPAAALKNISRLLAPGGRVVHLEHGTPVNGPYLIYPVDWFYDYYLINGFASCHSYVAHFQKLDGPWDVYEFEPAFFSGQRWETRWSSRAPLKLDFMIICVAQNATGSTWERSPIQSQYRSAPEHREYEQASIRYWEARNQSLGNGRSGAPPHLDWRRYAHDRRSFRSRFRKALSIALGTRTAATPSRRDWDEPPFTFCCTLSATKSEQSWLSRINPIPTI